MNNEPNSTELLLLANVTKATTQNPTDQEDVVKSAVPTTEPLVDVRPRKRLCASKSVFEDKMLSSPPKKHKYSVVCKLVHAKCEEQYTRQDLARAYVAHSIRLDDFEQLLPHRGEDDDNDDDDDYIDDDHDAKSKKQGRWNTTARGGGGKRSGPQTPKERKAPSLMGGSPTNSRAGRAPTLVYEGPPKNDLLGGWPDGWTQKTYQRYGSTGRDSYYYPPGSDRRYRSLVEVLRFLERWEFVRTSPPGRKHSSTCTTTGTSHS